MQKWEKQEMPASIKHDIGPTQGGLGEGTQYNFNWAPIPLIYKQKILVFKASFRDDKNSTLKAN